MAVTMESLNEKWTGIISCPLDIPKIEPDNWNDFWEIWNREKGPTFNRTRAAAPVLWNGLDLIEIGKTQRNKYESTYSPQLAESCVKMMASIREHMPYINIARCRLWESIEVIKPHRDKNKEARDRMPLPAQFRSMLSDTNPSPTFYLSPVLNENETPQEGVVAREIAFKSGKRYYIDSMLEDTNSFVFDGTKVYHGSDYDPQYSKIILVLGGRLDLEKYDDIMERSSKKYANRVMRLA
jgi:hypothetical protein